MAHLVSTDRERLLRYGDDDRYLGSPRLQFKPSRIHAPACGATPGTGTWAARTSRRRPASTSSPVVRWPAPRPQAPAPARALPQPARRLGRHEPSWRLGSARRARKDRARVQCAPEPPAAKPERVRRRRRSQRASRAPRAARASRVSTTNCATYQSTIADSPNRIVRIAGWSRDGSRAKRAKGQRARGTQRDPVRHPAQYAAMPREEASGPSRANERHRVGRRVETRTSASRMPRRRELSFDRIEPRHEGVGRLHRREVGHWRAR